MGSIGKYTFRTTPASLARISVGLAGTLGIVRALGGIDQTDHRSMILTLLDFDGPVIPALAIGESNTHLPRLLGWPAA
jgi:hypothetical protein